MKKLFLVLFTLFLASNLVWSQNSAEKYKSSPQLTQAQKEMLDQRGTPPTDWSQIPPNQVTGIVKFSQGFEDVTFPPAGWAVHQLDGGANIWLRYTSAPIFGTATASVRWESASLRNDDWLVTPSFTVDAADKLFFYGVGGSAYADSVSIWVSTTGGVPPTGYTRIGAFRPMPAPGQMFQLSLAAYAGQTVYLAFRYNEMDQLRLYLDSVYVETGVPNDVGTVSHNVSGAVAANVAMTPTATVKNFGGAAQSFPVTMTINPGGYTSTKQVTNLAPDQTTQVTFDTWTPVSGSYTAKAFTQLAGDANPANDTITRTAFVESFLYSNGPFVTNPGGGFGGADLSALQTSNLNVWGFGAQSSASNWVADNFEVPYNNEWTLQGFKFYSYQTGSTTTPTYNSAKVVVYNGRPDLPTSTIVWGDETTERYMAAEWTGAYRASDNTPTNADRPVMAVSANANPVLPAGNYWVMYTLGGTLASGPWVIPISILGTYETGDAYQRTTAGWAPLRDSAGGPGYGQGLPFQVLGTSQVIPVELSSFMANVMKNDITLNWTTATETNNMGFEVERKLNEGAFTKIGFVNGNGTTTEGKEYSYTDQGLASGKYTYRLRQVDFDGTSEYSNEVEAVIDIPTEYALAQNFPNPFNPSTTIEFSLKADARVTLKLYNALGQEVKTILGDNYAMGNYKIDFNASGLNSGVYFYTIEASGVDGSKFTATKKMILMK
ncbi:MAG: choice-of-anchor J domain-containing protein [Ignavibacteriales bacterium]|nr:choice-of-anchor J domain-containing protein [Ignavibacteriales bacterium]